MRFIVYHSRKTSMDKSLDTDFLPSNIFTRSAGDKRMYARIELGITIKNCAPKVDTKNGTTQTDGQPVTTKKHTPRFVLMWDVFRK